MATTYYRNADGDWQIDKDPDATLGYKLDFNAADRDSNTWLGSGETISTAVVTVASGLTKDSDSITDSGTSVTVNLSGGTAGTTYTVAIKITTSAGNIDERSFIVNVLQR